MWLTLHPQRLLLRRHEQNRTHCDPEVQSPAKIPEHQRQ